ncbi:chalcone isomerase family protein [Aquimarina brevivitae]|uniref:Uncharacterized protein DUF2147 n=1 Tax=Aquimarina brevivitae TaxID=323412 RepID=A0A4Q7NY24_9FLAO|nr:chalcone isomerase family protein [Aquimarina brevivitae]RZS92205.1 uncharacterized protein DUF2147 [Aquimarina brevivitae]
MKKILFLFLASFIYYSGIAQTKVGELYFNDIDTFDDKELVLNGAGKRDNLYAVGLYLNLDLEINGPQDGVMVAEKNSDMAITIKVTDGTIGCTELREMLRLGLERATDGNSYLLEKEIRDFLAIFPSDINRYDIFDILYKKNEGIFVFRNNKQIGTLKDLEFKKALFKIWLGDNPIDQTLKEELLKAYKPNPVLGKWKTYDKDTGVGISIVQLYMIDKKVFGSIQQMLRQSERDAVCYKCQGADKNQKVEGLVIIKNLKKKDEAKFADGTFTNINDGEVSPCQIWVDEDQPDILKVRYRGGGGVHEWKRIKEPKKEVYTTKF